MERKKGSTIALVVAVAIITLAIGAFGLRMYFKTNNLILVNKQQFDAAHAMYEKYDKFIDIQRLIDNSFLWDYDEAAEKEAI